MLIIIFVCFIQVAAYDTYILYFLLLKILDIFPY